MLAGNRRTPCGDRRGCERGVERRAFCLSQVLGVWLESDEVFWMSKQGVEGLKGVEIVLLKQIGVLRGR